MTCVQALENVIYIQSVPVPPVLKETFTFVGGGSEPCQKLTLVTLPACLVIIHSFQGLIQKCHHGRSGVRPDGLSLRCRHGNMPSASRVRKCQHSRQYHLGHGENNPLLILHQDASTVAK